MNVFPWYLCCGLLLIFLAITSSVIRRSPLSVSIICLLFGVFIGPQGLGLLHLDMLRDAPLIEHFAEVAMIVSLFAAGLQLRLPLYEKSWRVAGYLASGGMVITIALVCGLGMFLGLSLGAAVLLGAVLAPTDPVLASDVQVKDSMDTEPLRFVLTAEAGLNDGAAFPFVMLGLGILGCHELGTAGTRWFVVDLLWAVPFGLVIGGVLGTLVGKAVLYLRLQHQQAVGRDNFLAVGLMALSYGLALMTSASGFLAVFAAGVALRRVERTTDQTRPEDFQNNPLTEHGNKALATTEGTAAVYMAETIVNFNAHLERFAEVALVALVGSLLQRHLFEWRILLFVIAFLFLVRPLAVALTLFRVPMPILRRGLIGWFGIRGIGSIYNLSFAIEHGFRPHLPGVFIDAVLATIAASIVLHGISVTPLMKHYKSRSSDR